MADRKRVLVVDDNRDAVDLICRALEQRGYATVPAYGGTEALETARTGTIDCILLDVMMSDLGGLEVCRQLKAEAATSRLPVMMLSAKTDPADVAQGKAAGADGYLTKPISISKLVAAIELHCSSKPPEPSLIPAQTVLFVGSDTAFANRTQGILDAARAGGRDWFRLDVKRDCEAARAAMQADVPRAVIIDGRDRTVRDLPALCRQIKMNSTMKQVVVVVMLSNPADDVKYAWANECLYDPAPQKLAETLKRHLLKHG